MSDCGSDLEDFTCRGITSFLNSANAKFASEIRDVNHSISPCFTVYRLSRATGQNEDAFTVTRSRA